MCFLKRYGSRILECKKKIPGLLLQTIACVASTPETWIKQITGKL